MKDPFGRTKVVMRHLPPAIAESALMEQIDGRFSGRYNWVRFRHGKTSQKNQRCSRAYVDLKRPDDVLEFADYFNGHTFVNEKGAQFKAMVEYAPSQCVPEARSKKDGREGTILKDPEYLEFLELLSKPVENLPSAEIQLERREAERAGAIKEAFVVTPLMDFIRQKRAARRSQRATGNGKLSRRAEVASVNSSGPSPKRSTEKRRGPNVMYVTRDGTKNGSGKDKSTYVLVSRKEQPLPAKPVLEGEPGTGSNGTVTGVAAGVETGKRRVTILKGKQREDSHGANSYVQVSDGLAQQKNIMSSSVRNSPASLSKQNHRQEASGRTVRSILTHKEGGQGASHTEQQMQTTNSEKDKRPPRPSIARPIAKDYASRSSLTSFSDNDSKRYINDKVSLNGPGSVSNTDKHDKRRRNKERPDRGVWATFRRSDESHPSEETLSSSSLSAQMPSDSLDSIQAMEAKVGSESLTLPNSCTGLGSNALTANHMPLRHGEISFSRSGEIRSGGGGGRLNPAPVENALRHVGRRGPAPNFKEVDSSMSLAEGRLSKRGPSGHGSHERQVWIQKSGSAS
ncbi:regulator of nonsense transcripts UPF3-like [Iris pallida]|uniref:Regulator of nonsense transcripts UPF3-like n=1 Tax=Iris pallida TaxID=29817 RepID=A0AAX6GZS6_IRIPA|nr:regulator of nonsense transcripts UPF3-like [Iris pallida]KAJ6834073.1 regulator of nonsense transcripts UPF3-like [Iris pallida]